MITPTGSTATIGDLIDGDYGVIVYCEAHDHRHVRCGHSAWLDLDVVAYRLGREHGALAKDLLPKLYCSKCGNRQVSIRLHPMKAWSRH